VRRQAHISWDRRPGQRVRVARVRIANGPRPAAGHDGVIAALAYRTMSSQLHRGGFDRVLLLHRLGGEFLSQESM